MISKHQERVEKSVADIFNQFRGVFKQLKQLLIFTFLETDPTDITVLFVFLKLTVPTVSTPVVRCFNFTSLGHLEHGRTSTVITFTYTSDYHYHYYN